MAIFTQDHQHTNEGSGATIIASGTKIKGEIDTQCHLHIDGEFEGVIHSSHTINIGKSGVVNGEIYSEKLIVNGKFVGSVKSRVVEIMPQGKIDGKVTSHELVIERKGILTGESIVEDGDRLE
ncbi:polymer-forming cytoskeletal family protein [Helicobacter enhydrae]|uniref:Polymer-forming cytoskeletal family protein n=1 Tax=Helicobacter enhydrae TaxID=222136 RepID=A0A1B1U4X8_9HELI|nr:polymer-forming cytoskeletal protein [Helicobacter enhydrae]ANV97762.1 polymer-forming cytoskeletal family protein [Helicobacter enhydrae]